jgi:beta-mannosidase
MNCGWGWKQRYNRRQREAIWHSYDTLFHKIIPDVVIIEDPTRPYWPSSPQADWGEHSSYSSAKGDMHYWGVWHGNEPFDSYYRVIGRFMSEYGFQSLPDMNSIKKFTLPHDWDFESEILLSHQRSGYGNSRILDYMKKLYPVPEDFRELLYVGQVMQAEAIKSAIQAHRAAKPYCMGTLYWQLNDCWPAASWSGIDYYTSWKALHYFVKKAYAPVTISFYPDEDRKLRVFLNNDLLSSKEVAVQYTIRNFEGDVLTGSGTDATLDPYGAVEAMVIDLDSIEQKYNIRDIYLQVDLSDTDNITVTDCYYFAEPKNLDLPEVSVSLITASAEVGVNLQLNSDKLVKNLYLWTDGIETHFSDNYFDLLPNETKIVSFKPDPETPISEDEIHTLSLNSIINKINSDP